MKGRDNFQNCVVVLLQTADNCLRKTTPWRHLWTKILVNCQTIKICMDHAGERELLSVTGIKTLSAITATLRT
jgi:hypothetical protein